MNNKVRKIIAQCAEKHNVRPEMVLGKTRIRSAVAARHEAIYIVRKYLRPRADRLSSYSYPNIGRMFGGLDHSTVIHACKKHRERMGAE